MHSMDVDAMHPVPDRRDCQDTKRYPSVSPTRMAQIAPLMPASGRTGRPRESSFAGYHRRATLCLQGAMGDCFHTIWSWAATVWLGSRICRRVLFGTIHAGWL